MRRSSIVELCLVVALTGGCGLERTGSASTPPTSVAASPSPSAGESVPLPAGFPLPPGAAPVAMPNDDPGLIGLWTLNAGGSAAYDFFLRALPAAGFPITGAYAGDTVAQFLFNVPGGEPLQIDIHAIPNLTTRIEVRLPRP